MGMLQLQLSDLHHSWLEAEQHMKESMLLQEFHLLDIEQLQCCLLLHNTRCRFDRMQESQTLQFLSKIRIDYNSVDLESDLQSKVE